MALGEQRHVNVYVDKPIDMATGVTSSGIGGQATKPHILIGCVPLK